MNFSLNQNLDFKKWDAFIKANSLDGGFLQSAGWGDFQLANGRKIWRLAVEADGKMMAAALIVKHQLPYGQSYFYSPRGPVVSRGEAGTEAVNFLILEIKKIAKQERAMFLRVDPAWTELDILNKNNFKFSGQVQPKSTLILDLTLTEDQLLKNMKSKTRYNIKIGERNEIFADYSQNTEAVLAEFWDLMGKTATRDSIKTHKRDYYLKMLNVPGVKLVFARSQNIASGRALAVNIMAFWGEWCVYLHGASDYEFRDKMAPYALQWEMIKTAKKQGCKFYDFWGADEKKWPGVTRFKVGFAPDLPLTQYVGAYDLAFNKVMYFVYKLLLKVRR